MKITPAIFLTIAMLLILHLGIFADDETKEPPIKYRLEVEGKSYTILESEPLKLTGTLTNPTVKLVAEPNREFRYGGIFFLYPRAFTFDASTEDASSKNWTLTGVNCNIMYFNMIEELSAEDYADALEEQFGKSNCSNRAKHTVDLLGEKLESIKFNVKLANHLMTMNIIRLPTTKGTKLLALQDSPDETGKASKESVDSLALLQKSMVMKKEGVAK